MSFRRSMLPSGGPPAGPTTVVEVPGVLVVALATVRFVVPELSIVGTLVAVRVARIGRPRLQI